MNFWSTITENAKKFFEEVINTDEAKKLFTSMAKLAGGIFKNIIIMRVSGFRN